MTTPIAAVRPFEVGLLDLCLINAGEQATDALWNTIDLAPRAEQLGYARFWLGEHHNPEMAHSCPEMFVGLLAGLTRTIRVGTGGILLRFHSPLKVAKTFRLLHGIFPDRIDLGIARGSADPAVQRLLCDGHLGGDLDAKWRLLGACLAGDVDVAVQPFNVPPPQVWMLGTHESSAVAAATAGAALCIGLFSQHDDCLAMIARYRAAFTPRWPDRGPRVALAVAGVCTDDAREAEAAVAGCAGRVAPTVVGSAAHCRALFDAMREDYAPDEFIFLDVSQSHASRLRSIERLAAALDITPRGTDRETARDRTIDRRDNTGNT